MQPAPPRVLLLNMPFVSVSRPAIGISLLKARLGEAGIDCDIGYANLLFAERVGMSAYGLINDRLTGWMFAGDWLFAQHLFPEENREPYLETLKQNLQPGEFDTIICLRETVSPFLQECLDRYDVASHDIIGFTTTFEQNLASLAMAALVKRTFPDKITVFGGGNCEGVMGIELHRRFDWIDYVCTGEADFSFPALVERLRSRRPAEDIPGVVYRAASKTRLSGPAAPVRRLDMLPDPDYDDYFRQLRDSSIATEVRPALLIESGRGCWWGEKSHCTFCGLNGSSMTFRAKSAPRVYAELERQKERYGIGQFLAVDNIMSYRYFEDLLPMLRESNPGITLFYEIKSNLKRQHIELLRDAGVLAIQPGIESLSSNVLRLMRKGVTAIQNVALLRFCREYGVELAWNLLYGFPGETADDYQDTARVIEAIYHLRPPGVVARIRLDRFSPNFNQAAEFGLSGVRPFPLYRHIYPLPEEGIANLAYFFDYSYCDGRDPALYVTPVLERVQLWQQNQGGDLVKSYEGNGELVLIDSRPGHPRLNYPLSGLQRHLYEFCDDIRSRASIDDFVALQEGHPVELTPLLEQLVGYHLMLREGNRYLSLAVDTQRRKPANAPEPATF
jgi:ribosomal peptide maturation radical SAM protein 1